MQRSGIQAAAFIARTVSLDSAFGSIQAAGLTRCLAHVTVPAMDTPPMTDYFRNDVLSKRTYIRLDWCLRAIAEPLRREVQAEDGRIRHWVYIEEPGKYLRVVTLEDGATLDNAFPDRRFKP